jgi:hypothetical protein
MSEALHHPAHSRQANKWVGEKPGGDASQGPDDGELGQHRSSPAVQQQRDADQHRRMDDVDRIGAAVEPRPESGRLIHARAEEQQPGGNQPPRR